MIFLFKGLLLINLNWKSNVSLEFLITYSVFYSCEIFPYRILAYFRHSPRLKSLCQPQTILAQARWHNLEKCNTNLTVSKYHCLLYNFVLITRCWWFDQLILGISMKIVMTLDACSLKHVHLDIYCVILTEFLVPTATTDTRNQCKIRKSADITIGQCKIRNSLAIPFNIREIFGYSNDQSK